MPITIKIIRGSKYRTTPSATARSIPGTIPVTAYPKPQQMPPEQDPILPIGSRNQCVFHF